MHVMSQYFKGNTNVVNRIDLFSLTHGSDKHCATVEQNKLIQR